MKLALILVSSVLSAYGADEWLRLKSSNFELFTSAGERKGKQAILYFEQMRSLFQRFSGNQQAPSQPVRLIAFRNDKEFAPYRPNETAAAFYLPGNQRDYIVMRNIAEEFYPVALHEYTHLIVKHSGAKLPVWLNEGIAELYASTRPVANKIQIGGVLPGRAAVLAGSKLIPLDQLFAAGHDSPFYNEKDRAGMFYAQSWLLAHMLHFSPDYRPKAAQYLAVAGKGTHSSKAFFDLYGKSVQDVEKDLERYRRSDTVYVVNLDAKLEKSAEAPVVEPAPAFDVEMALADLLASMHDKRDAAAARYKELAAANPGRTEVEEALGWLALRGNDKQTALSHFERAAKAGSSTPKLYFDFAMLVWESDRGSARVVELLKKVVQLNTKFPDGHWQLAMAALNARDYETAGIALARIRSVTPERAFPMFEGLARVQYETGRFEDAKKSAARAREFAKSPSQLDYITRFQQAIDYKLNPAAPPAPAPVEEAAPRLARRTEEIAPPPGAPKPVYPSLDGVMLQLDCMGEQARLHVESAGKRVTLLIRDPSLVEIRNTGEVTHEFVCGPQKREPVKIEFTPEASGPAIGAVVSIEFRKP